MNNREHIQEELKQISTYVAAVPSYNVFTVPEGYFKSFPAECMSWIAVSPSFGSHSNPQLAPDGYFENLASEILGKIKEDKEPVLLYTPKQNPFTIPSGYFNELSGTIMEKVDSPAKVISISKKFFQYAAAAVITGLLGLGIFNRFNDKSVIPQEIAVADV